MKKLDLYIIKKFLGTFFFSLVLILCIVVVFDLSEKIEKLLEHNATFEAVVFDYYINFIPFFANTFASIFTLIFPAVTSGWRKTAVAGTSLLWAALASPSPAHLAKAAMGNCMLPAMAAPSTKFKMAAPQNQLGQHQII